MLFIGSLGIRTTLPAPIHSLSQSYPSLEQGHKSYRKHRLTTSLVHAYPSHVTHRSWLCQWCYAQILVMSMMFTTVDIVWQEQYC